MDKKISNQKKRTQSKRKKNPVSKKTKAKQSYKKRKQVLNILSNGLFFLFVFLCLLFLFKVKAHLVEGSSMLETLENGDRIFINKGEKPTRYSIVTLDPLKKEKESYVKRVIGLPGDMIWLEGTSLFLNQEKASVDLDSNNSRSSQLPDGTIKITLSKTVAKEIQGMKQIPKDSYFVLGDNRNHSNDSRSFGFVSEKQIEGVAIYRYYPLTRLGRLH